MNIFEGIKSLWNPASTSNILDFSLILHRDEINLNRSSRECEIQLLQSLEKCTGWLPQTKTLTEEKSPFGEQYIHLQCSVKTNNQTKNINGHFSACQAWTKTSEVFQNFSQTHRPWLTITNENMLYNNRRLFHETVAIESISFGTLTHPSLYCEHLKNSVPKNTRVRVLFTNFYHHSNYLEIINEASNLTMELQYSSIKRIILSTTKENNISLFLEISNPPKTFRSTIEILKTDTQKTFTKRERILSYFDANNENKSVSIYGKSNTIKMVFKDNVVFQIVSRLYHRCNRLPINFVCMKEEQIILSESESNDYNKLLCQNLTFECAYLLNAILERNFVWFLQDTKEYPKIENFILNMNRENAICLESALIKILSLTEVSSLVNYSQLIRKLYDWYAEDNDRMENMTKNSVNIPETLDYIRKCVITPTRKLFYAKEIMVKNRFLRTFDSEFALKVSIRDDNLNNLSSFNCHDTVYETAIRKPMNNSIEVQNRQYTLLGWSNSQLREHSVWMYSKDNDRETSKTIPRLMGDFSTIHCVAKYMARFGQCFTSSEDTIRLTPESVETVSDIEGGINPLSKKPFCFSDGVGQISSQLLEKVCKKLKLEVRPSAFQIRYEGYKGMLVLNPLLLGEKIIFRKSMRKFSCSDSDHALEIVKYSQPTPVYLNRPFITILEHMKVPYSEFAKLQELTLKKITNVLLFNEDAADVLSSRCSLYGLDYFDLTKAGISLNSNPFFRGILLALHRSSTEQVRKKCRLQIDPKNGRTLFGVLDETDTLKYGQIFLQITKNILSENDPQAMKCVIQGNVMVTKNPCMQPGDVRIFEAINVKGLNHIVDCIVFPQKGPRPHPDEMAGSDLDGDEYSVIWDSNLMFKCKNEPASFFPVPNEKLVKGEITQKHITQFLENYIRKSKVGLIADAHLAQADQQREGLSSLICRGIATKYSLAVDFGKSGDEVHLSISEQPKKFPDFMEKPNSKESYKSVKALGKLYRTCRTFENIIEESSFTYDNITLDEDLIYPGWKSYEKTAKETLRRYNTRLETICTRFGLNNETEVFTGVFTKMHNYAAQRNEIHTAGSISKTCVASIWKDFAEEFETEFINKCASKDGSYTYDVDNLAASFKALIVDKAKDDDTNVEKLKKASAWYIATYSNPKSIYLSFPWIVSKYLTIIKSLQIKESIVNPLLVKMNDDLKSCQSLEAIDKTVENRLRISLPERYSDSIKFDEIKLAFRAIQTWASENRILDHPEPGLAFNETEFIDLFVYVCNRLNYIDNAKHFPVSIVIKMISFSTTLSEQDQVFTTKCNSQYLKEVALRTYHTLSISQSLAALGIAIEGEVAQRTCEMETVKIPCKLIESGRQMGYIPHIELLKKYSHVDEVQIHEQPGLGIAIVTAAGNIKNINILRELLESTDSRLEVFFSKVNH